MTAEMWFTVAVIALPLTFVFRGRWRPDTAGLFMIVALGAAQFTGLAILGAQGDSAAAMLAISGFGQPLAVILVGLFILTQVLARNGVILWLGQTLATAARRAVSRLVFLFTLSAALLSLLMNNVAVGSLLLPSAIQAARKSHVKTSRLLIPIAFGTALGGMATYFTTANIVLSQVLTIAQPPQEPLGILTFVPVGGAVALAGIAYLTLFGYRLVPARRPAPEQMLARRDSDELEGLYQVGERLWEGRVRENSELVGSSLQSASLGEKLGIAVVAMRRGYQAYFVPSAGESVRAGDVLLAVGREERLAQLAALGVDIQPERHTITNFGLTVVEFILSPHSVYAGKTIKELDFRRKYGFTVVAIQRAGRSFRTDVGTMALQRGDALLIAGPPSRVRDLQADRELIVFEPDPTTVRVPTGRAIASVLVFGLAVVLSIIGVPIYLAVLAAVLTAVLGRFITLAEAYRSIEWEIVVFVVGMHAASLALVNTGMADLLGSTVLALVGNAGGLALAAVAFAAAATLTQVMGSQATAFIIGPISVSAAISLRVDPQAVAVATAIGCSAAFLTPMAHPVNLIMVGPGNYRFGDFFKAGAGLMVVTFMILLVALRVFWGL